MTSKLTNRSHRGAYKAGMNAKREGLPRMPPYTGDYPSKPYLDRAWLWGYDLKKAQ